MIKKGFLLASFAIGVFANIFAQDTLSFKKTRDKNIYVEFLGSSNLIGVSFDSRFTPISPWGYRLGVSYFQGGDSFIKASNSNRGLFFPIEVNFLTSGNKHKLELGLGSNLGIYNEHISFIEKSKDQYETINLTSNTTFGYYFFSNIGYRYISTKYNPQIQISAESETKRSIFREKDKTKRSKKESAQHSKSRNKSFVMTSVSAL